MRQRKRAQGTSEAGSHTAHAVQAAASLAWSHARCARAATRTHTHPHTHTHTSRRHECNTKKKKHAEATKQHASAATDASQAPCQAAMRAAGSSTHGVLRDTNTRLLRAEGSSSSNREGGGQQACSTSCLHCRPKEAPRRQGPQRHHAHGQSGQQPRQRRCMHRKQTSNGQAARQHKQLTSSHEPCQHSRIHGQAEKPVCTIKRLEQPDGHAEGRHAHRHSGHRPCQPGHITHLPHAKRVGTATAHTCHIGKPLPTSRRAACRVCASFPTAGLDRHWPNMPA